VPFSQKAKYLPVNGISVLLSTIIRSSSGESFLPVCFTEAATKQNLKLKTIIPEFKSFYATARVADKQI
jgi:hypothetical protein